MAYEFHPKGDVLYKFGELKDCMYIIIDGKVDFSVHMRDEQLSESEVRELGDDVGIKDIAKDFNKFKHQHNLFEA